MKRIFVYTFLFAVITCISATAKQADMYGDQLGSVHTPFDCSQEAMVYVDRGTALLHHMTYEGSRAAFVTSLEIDSECVAGYWGQAMTYIHPLWSDPPSEDEFEKGRKLLKQAKVISKNNEHTLSYISAAEAYYLQGQKDNEKDNLKSFAETWKKVSLQFPEDQEAASFYALALMATADPNDKTFATQKAAGAIAEGVLEKVPDHPGGHHYTIHAYDYPSLAIKALKAARNYGHIAPDIPHALHMPTHIYTRLGFWEESIDMNRRSAAAAIKHPAGERISLHYLHALDYMAYAFLQRGEDAKAEEVLGVLGNLKGPYQPHVASAYTFAAIPARIVLERQQWEKAAKLQPRIPGNYPWEKYPAMEAVTYFAKALGAARSGDVQAASKALSKLEKLRDTTAESSKYWAKQIEIQRLSAQAWLMFEEGRKHEAVQVMRSGAELEASTEKHPVTPGEVLTARELYADMLVEYGQYRESLSEYEKSLVRNPNRFNSLFGAGRAAELAGDTKKAAYYYGKLKEITSESSTEQARLQHVMAFFEK